MSSRTERSRTVTYLLIALVAIIVAYIAYYVVLRKDKPQATEELLAALNMAALNPELEYTLISGNVSPPSLKGAMISRYCVQLPEFSVADEHKNRWAPVSEMMSSVKDAVAKALIAGEAASCFGRTIDDASVLQTSVFSLTRDATGVLAYSLALFDAKTGRFLYVREKA